MNASERNALSTDNKNIQQARRRGGPRGSLVKDGGFSLVQVPAFDLHNEKAKQLHEMYHGLESALLTGYPAYQERYAYRS